jgi:phosphoenolpyruvate-protein kinase (PTS system EI component)
MVAQIADLLKQVQTGHLLRVDGDRGEVCLDPPVEALGDEWTAPVTALTQPSMTVAAPKNLAGLPRIEANINLIFEVERAVRHGAAGVGLFRTEFLFLARRTLPTEEEQVGIYHKLLELLNGLPAAIRTYDLRPDKVSHLRESGASAAHPLDWRLVLGSPPLQKIFKDQVRAILRAAVAGNARILVPLVTRSEQLDFVVEAVNEAKEELTHEGLEHAANVPLGIMIEVAAVMPMVSAWATKVDFFALGTNDLVASALGISREVSAELAAGDPLHPGFLFILNHVIEAARSANRPITVCGEMAGDPAGATALTALGVDSLSVAVHQLAVVQQTLSGLRSRQMPALAKELGNLRTAADARAFLQMGNTAELKNK